MRSPRSVDIEITGKCNLRCLYCSHFTSASDISNDLPKEEWLEFFKGLNRCSVMDVTLSGGEPFCRSDIREIIEGIILNRMRFSILTNGTLITDELAAFLSSTRRCKTVQVSIDGSIPSTHDVFRGEGNFMRAMEGVKLLRAHDVPVSIRVTIHRGNVGDLDNIAKLLLEDLGLPEFSTNAASYMGLCRKNKKQVQLTADEYMLAMESLLRLNKKYDGRISASAGPLSDARRWAGMEEALSKGERSIPDRGYLTGCNGPLEKFAVRPDGVIVPCLQLSHMELGHINRDSLLEIWQHHPKLTMLRERHTIPLSQFEFCNRCKYIPYCTGNCPALAYTLTGEVNHPSPEGCLRRFIEEGGRVADIYNDTEKWDVE
ncbi:SynChlorMet cassette radical SAM/SPASM protein ScmE [Methanocella paludicola]|nr:SynChlorMet cassette radical SAM/SPASM protein ScmE [Methanocella paludicola]